MSNRTISSVTKSKVRQIQLVAVGVSDEDIWAQDGDLIRLFDCDAWEVRLDGVTACNIFRGEGEEVTARAFAMGAQIALRSVGVFSEIVELDESTPRAEAGDVAPFRSAPVCGSVPVRGDAAHVLLGAVYETENELTW